MMRNGNCVVWGGRVYSN